MKVIIVGGVAGGATAAARLRRLDEKVEIIIFERGEFISFANCGLPYYISGEISNESSLKLQTPAGFKSRYNVDVRVLNEVISIDRDKKSVSVKNLKTGDECVESYDKLIISTGAKAISPKISGFDLPNVFSIRDIPDISMVKKYIEDTSPKSVAIIGGGFIGIEMAENLKMIGLDVTIIDKAKFLLPPIDDDVACEFHQYVRQSGIKLKLNDGVEKISSNNGKLSIHLSKDVVEADFVISSIGVTPESNLAKDANLETNVFGSIVVDSHMRTKDDDIYAIGDVAEVTNSITGQTTFVPLAGPANKQGRIVADNILGIKSEYKGTIGSSILKFFNITVATTGINEKTAKKLGLNYDKVFTLSPSHAGYYPGGYPISIKTIFEKTTGKILGSQLIGKEGVDKRCDVIATAIKFGASAKDLTELELCYAPPFSSAKDPVNMAGYVIENVVNGKIKNFHWDKLDTVKDNEDTFLLDVRTKGEVMSGAIDGFTNIPVDDLRNNLNLLPKDKKIYVTCLSGLRSYLACKILINNGFDCYNISGGYRLKSLLENECLINNYNCYGNKIK